MPVRLLLNMRLEEFNLPLSWVALEAGCSEPALRRLKNERAASIKFETLSRLCEILYCEPGELLEFVPNPITRHEWMEKRSHQAAKIRDRLNNPVIRDQNLVGRSD